MGMSTNHPQETVVRLDSQYRTISAKEKALSALWITGNDVKHRNQGLNGKTD